MKEKEFPGNFIVIEGADGAGTTTQSRKLAEELGAYYTAEPTGAKAGKKVDEMISSGDYSAEAIALMFAADRRVHLEEDIIPKLENGETVVCDRYYHSSLVYQPTLGADYQWVLELNKSALTPDLTVILDVSTQIALSRIDERERDISHEKISSSDDDLNQTHLTFFEENGSGGNIFENMGFQEEVVARYRELQEMLGENIELIDASPSVEKVFGNIMDIIDSRID